MASPIFDMPDVDDGSLTSTRQSVVFSTWFSGLAAGSTRTGVYDGFDVTSGAGLSVNVAAGHGLVDGSIVRTIATTNLALTADATHPRFATVHLNLAAQAVQVTLGTPAASPVPPEIDPATDAQLAAVWIPAGNGSRAVQAGDIVPLANPIASADFHSLAASSFATGLGVGDDWTVAIQTALNWCALLWGGGRVVLPPFLVEISGTLFLPTAVDLVGVNMKASIIRLKAGTNLGTDRCMIESGTFNGLGYTQYWSTNQAAMTATTGTVASGLFSLTVDGNKENSAVGHGIGLYGVAHATNHLLVRDCTGFGFRSAWAQSNAYGPVGHPDGHSLEAHYHGLVLQDNDAGNADFRGPHDMSITHLIGVMQNRTGGYSAGVHNINLDDHGGAAQILHWHLWGGDCERGLSCTVGSVRGTDIVVEGAREAQMYLDDSGGMQLSNIHVFGQSNYNQRGLVLAGVGTARITGKTGGCPGGGVVIDGDGTWASPANGDFGNNIVEMLSRAAAPTTDLTNAINASQTTFDVDSPAKVNAGNFGVSGHEVYIRVDSEWMEITGLSGDTVTVTRGVNSPVNGAASTAASHSAGATVRRACKAWTGSPHDQSVYRIFDQNPGGLYGDAALVKLATTHTELAFFTGDGQTKQTITGDTTTTLGDLQSVVKDLLTALDGHGLLTDSTT